jgi:hypothetical protein
MATIASGTAPLFTKHRLPDYSRPGAEESTHGKCGQKDLAAACWLLRLVRAIASSPNNPEKLGFLGFARAGTRFTFMAWTLTVHLSRGLFWVS